MTGALQFAGVALALAGFCLWIRVKCEARPTFDSLLAEYHEVLAYQMEKWQEESQGR